MSNQTLLPFEGDKFEANIVGRYAYWTVFLSPRHGYLGRCYIALNRDGMMDPYVDTTPEEYLELRTVKGAVTAAQRKLWTPDNIDYYKGQNEWFHTHVHVVPRYNSPRVVNGEKFVDANPGGNYSPYDRSFEIATATFEIIKQQMRDELIVS